jgi:hypothetical protein
MSHIDYGEGLSVAYYGKGSFTIDAKGLAKGLYAMIKEHPDSACMMLGMFPANIMEAFDEGLKKAIPDDFCTGRGTGHYEEFIGAGKELRSKIHRDVSAEILRLATADGVCEV